MKPVWQKLGLIYCPRSAIHPKLMSHAANPLPVRIDDDLYRVYYSSRDSNNFSSVAAVDIDMSTYSVVKEYPKPFLEYGPPGSFYESGISIGCDYQVGDSRYILFMGWQNCRDQHWRGDIGRIKINLDFSLCMDKEEPFFRAEYDEIDPLSLSYPCVAFEESKGYSMWYGSTKTWNTGSGEMLHVINSAFSKDGVSFDRLGLAVPYELGVAQAFSRPTVINIDGSLHMWFSYRSGKGEKYRIGYAKELNGVWQLALEDTGIDVSENGWDSEMICYPWVFSHKENIFMFYNGNGYGKTGFGLAILKR